MEAEKSQGAKFPQDVQRKSRQIPEVGLTLQGPLVSSPDGLVCTEEELWFHFQRFRWSRRHPEQNPTHGAAHRHMGWRLSEPLPQRAEASLLPGTFHWGLHPHMNSYYHFLSDLMPHLLRAPCFPVLVRPDWPEPFETFLRSSGWAVQRLAPGAWVPEALVIPEESTPEWSAAKVAQLRAFFQKQVPSRRGTGRRRLYLSRAQATRRHLVNEAELLPVLEAFDVRPVQLEAYSIPEQVRLFREAEWIVAPHGAGLTNLLFAPRSVRVLEIRPVRKSGGGCYEQLAHAGGWERHEVLVPPKAEQFLCPPECLQRVLARWTRDAGAV